MLVLCLLAMPNVWAGTTTEGVQCRLNSDCAGLVAYVGKGGKKTATRVADRSTSFAECKTNMVQVLDRGREPRPMPAELYTLLSELPLLAGNASKAVRANDCQGGPRRVCPWQGLGCATSSVFVENFCAVIVATWPRLLQRNSRRN